MCVCTWACAHGYRKMRITRRVLFLIDRLKHTSIQNGKGSREGELDPGELDPERGTYGWNVALRRQRVGEGPASRAQIDSRLKEALSKYSADESEQDTEGCLEVKPID